MIIDIMGKKHKNISLHPDEIINGQKICNIIDRSFSDMVGGLITKKANEMNLIKPDFTVTGKIENLNSVEYFKSDDK